MTLTKSQKEYLKEIRKEIFAENLQLAQKMIELLNQKEDLTEEQKRAIICITSNGTRKHYRICSVWRLSKILGKKIKLTLE